ncbi:hypothetical protein [Morganella psychrotolerans]|uniref:hypothetical protein n=1 Tax=Morganella psychrotolerans TaxID=368603 RepID=UPI001AA01FA7|nr:hypothetical protein [Morganella psychrotolerans]
MFIHKIITPMFIKRFQCVGSECLSHCCQDWLITIDKKTYKKYHSSESIEIKQISQDHVIKSENGDDYAFIRLTDEKKMPVPDRKTVVQYLQQTGSVCDESHLPRLSAQ